MSLIEQAAKRLAELQRAGVDLPQTAAPAVSATERTPTPEALVREVAARQAQTGGPAPSAAAPVAGRVAGPDADVPAASPLRKVEIDLERLEALGLVTPDHLDSRIAHEVRVLKRPILRNVKGRGAKSIAHATRVMVTSALPGEGKTFTTANLALSMAMEFDDTVLLVDGDVAHPSLLELLGIEQSEGLLDLLTRDDIGIDDVVLQTNIEQLMILPAGTRHRRATELLASDRMTRLLDALSARFPGRMIVFDSPPLLPTTESRVLATHAGQVVMVVGADSTSRSAVEEALAAIERCECVMMVLNKTVSVGTGSYYGYYAGETPG